MLLSRTNYTERALESNESNEAIVAAGPMDLAGGSRKSLRKAVNRVARNGYTVVTMERLARFLEGKIQALEAKLAGAQIIEDTGLPGTPITR